jgi:indolepyruvate decarboxylase
VTSKSTDGNPSVAEYVVQRLAALGIKHAFGVPGDYAFPIDKAIEACPGLTWVGCSNELNAAYSADGYARINGAAILSTTYNVGSAAALAGVMGCRAERVPVFHLVGSPSTRLVRTRRHMHHSFADGSLDQFRPYHEVSVCASAYLTPQNAIAEIERVIFEAVSQRMPVYIEVPQDYAEMPVVGVPAQGVPFADTPTFSSNTKELEAALEAIRARLEDKDSPVILAGFTIARYGLQADLDALLKATNIRFATTGMSKGLLPESHPNFIGVYNGRVPLNSVFEIVEEADLVLDLGGVAFSDTETYSYSDYLDPSKVITVWPDHVEIGCLDYTGSRGNPTYGPIHMKDVLEALTKEAPAFEMPEFTHPAPVSELELQDRLPIELGILLLQLQQFLESGDTLVVDTGISELLAMFLLLPEGVQFQHAPLWGCIGWGTAASLGVALALADPKRRVILVQGDGGHQCTANQIGTMGLCNVNPIILLLNNGIYGIEEVVMGNGDPRNIQKFDEIAPWQYHLLPAAMGCDKWFVPEPVDPGPSLAAALQQARAYGGAAYIEIELQADSMAFPLPKDAIDRMYQTDPPNVECPSPGDAGRRSPTRSEDHNLGR